MGIIIDVFMILNMSLFCIQGTLVLHWKAPFIFSLENVKIELSCMLLPYLSWQRCITIARDGHMHLFQEN